MPGLHSDDNYCHSDINLVYVSENILGPSDSTADFKVMYHNFHSQIAKHCLCEIDCISCCICLSGTNVTNYSVSTKSLVLSKTRLKESDNIGPIFECNNLCRCPSTCTNRLVQFGPLRKLYYEKCGIKGLGLFCELAIEKGTFICEYAGEVITLNEANKRHNYNTKKNLMNYIFCLNEHSSYNKVQTIIDPSYFGNIGRYLNHSCNPNCLILPIRIDSVVPKLAIFAQCGIAPNTELTFDYGSSALQPGNVENLDQTKCMCGTPNCRGFLPHNQY